MATGTPADDDKVSREKQPAPSTAKVQGGQSLATRRGYNNNGTNDSISRGIRIPRGMALPKEEGYRTPMGEDYEQEKIDGFKRAHFQDGLSRCGHRGSSLCPDRAETPDRSGQVTPRRMTPRVLNFNHLSDKLDEKLSWRVRIRYFTWAAFSMNMATGGIANALYSGTIFFLFNIVLFLVNLGCMSARFYMYPETFKASLTHPTESLFMPAAVVSFGTILLNISQYGLHNVGYWLNQAVLVLFWIDVALAITASAGTYLMLWSSTTFTIAQMTPIWIFPAYPLLIIGPHAALLSESLVTDQAKIIILAGFTIQGIGYLVSLMIYAAYIYRLMTQKLPPETSRPGMFVSVGPSGFTAGALTNLSANIFRAFGPDYKGNGELAAMVLQLIADWVSLWIWGLACWFFLIALGAHISCVSHGRLTFSLPFFSFIFPNTALITSTFAIAKSFDCYALSIVGCVLTGLLILVWIIVFSLMLRAIYMRQIFWPQRQEDRDEGGFKAPEIRAGTLGAQFHTKDTSAV